MALVSKSSVITGLDATPVTRASTLEMGGVVRSAVGHIAAASFVGGTAGQWYAFARIPARARLTRVLVSGATTTSGAVSIGLYRTAANGGTAIDNACINASYDMAAAKNGATADGAAYGALARSQKLSTAFSTQFGTASATNDVEVDIALTIVTALGGSVAHTVEAQYVLED